MYPVLPLESGNIAVTMLSYHPFNRKENKHAYKKYYC